MSGMYKDDADDGIKSWYTGEGGQGDGDTKHKQVRSQTLTRGNKALKCNFDEQVPVRVFRKKSKHDCVYYYEGIYTVADVKYEPCSISSDVFVYKFFLCAIPGESLEIPSVRVVFSLPLVNGKRMFQRQRLGSDRPRDDREAAEASDGEVEGTDAVCRPAKRVKKSVVAAAQEKGTVTEKGKKKQKASSPALCVRSHLLCEDLSYGKENVPIPVFNELNDSRELPQLEYQPDYVWAEGVQEMVQPLLTEADHVRRQVHGIGCDCGVAVLDRTKAQDKRLLKAGREPKNGEFAETELYNYHKDNCLAWSNDNGLVECSSACHLTASTGPKRVAACKRNQQVTRGVALPLEVFMTEKMGWGLRCGVDVPIGAFVLSYIGEVTTERLAEQSDSNQYQYDLSHFVQQHKLLTKLGPERFAVEVEALHRIAPMPSTHAMFQTMVRAAAADADATLAPLAAPPAAPASPIAAAAAAGPVAVAATAAQAAGTAPPSPSSPLAAAAAAAAAHDAALGAAAAQARSASSPTRAAAAPSAEAAPAVPASASSSMHSSAAVAACVAPTASAHGPLPTPLSAIADPQLPSRHASDGTEPACRSMLAPPRLAHPHLQAAPHVVGCGGGAAAHPTQHPATSQPIPGPPPPTSTHDLAVPSCSSQSCHHGHVMGPVVTLNSQGSAAEATAVQQDVDLVAGPSGSVTQNATCSDHAAGPAVPPMMDMGLDTVVGLDMVTHHADDSPTGASDPDEDGTADPLRAGAVAAAAAALGLPPCPHSGEGWQMEAGAGPEFESLLVVDAQRRGNAARFINGRCGGGNLTAQVVFAKGARNSLFHYISFFANAHIKAGVEFSYDYHWNKAQKGADAVRQCFCDGLQPGSTDPADTAKMKALQDMYDGLFKKYKAQGHHKPDQASCKEMYEQMRPSPIPPPSHGHGFPRAALGQKFNGKGELRATGLHTNHGGGISYVSSVVRKKWPG
ncbi:MAG: hypothetical protein WDW36_000895 [Sanguina aurantia]